MFDLVDDFLPILAPARNAPAHALKIAARAARIARRSVSQFAGVFVRALRFSARSARRAADAGHIAFAWAVGAGAAYHSWAWATPETWGAAVGAAGLALCAVAAARIWTERFIAASVLLAKERAQAAGQLALIRRDAAHVASLRGNLEAELDRWRAQNSATSPPGAS